MIPRPLPDDFISRQPLATWSEIHFGQEKGWVGWRSCINQAIRKIGEIEDPGETLIELSEASKESASRVFELVMDLARSEHFQSESEIKTKWLYIVLSWLYENRSAIENPFREIEILYADFDYPDEIEAFVAFMPPKDGWRPGEHSQLENRERMQRLWQEFLEGKK